MARGLDILGDPWSMLVLREVFFGNGRFEAMKQRLGAADSVLTKRLAGLHEPGGLTTTAAAPARNTSSPPWAKTPCRCLTPS